jgi:hypothetical protein
VEVVAHDVKILEPKVVLGLRSLDHGQKEFLHGARIENRLFSVSPCRHVVASAIL